LFGQTYSRKFTVDILDQEGAEFSKDLEDGWLWFIRLAHRRGGGASYRSLSLVV